MTHRRRRGRGAVRAVHCTAIRRRSSGRRRIRALPLSWAQWRSLGTRTGVPSESCSVARLRHCSRWQPAGGAVGIVRGARFRHGFTTPAHIGAPAEPRTATEDCTRWRSSGDCPPRLEEPPRAQREQVGCTSKSTQKATLETGEKSPKGSRSTFGKRIRCAASTLSRHHGKR